MKQVQPEPDDKLVEILKRKEEHALKLLYRQHYTMITNMVVNNGGSIQEAKDIYQDAVIVLYEKLQDEQFELTCSVKTFLYSVSRNLWLKQLKARKRFEAIADSEEYVSPVWEQAGNTEDLYAAMAKALESMGEPCRTIVEDFYINKSSMEAITAKFGYTNTDNAKNQKYKCMQRLKKNFFTYYNSGGKEND